MLFNKKYIYMSQPINRKLYEEVKAEADTIYKKPSAYKSGFIVKTYKSRGGKYRGVSKDRPLERWFKETWVSTSGKDEYPVLRPTKRISKDTPLLASEIDPKNLKEQIKLKQKIKGGGNLPPFKKKKD
jgi:hypothetical protein